MRYATFHENGAETSEEFKNSWWPHGNAVMNLWITHSTENFFTNWSSLPRRFWVGLAGCLSALHECLCSM